jgi:exopolyphosphatase/guanosine-5'-triphosphate,3'-diphosphate pyrophosphatase
LLIADVDERGVRDVERRLEIVRLGQGVDATGHLAPEAIERTRVALAGYAEAIGKHGVDRIRMVATSASRDAANRDDFYAMVRATLGQDPEVITGDEEAGLSYAGAVQTLPEAAEPYLVVDIGGGSTEFVLGDRGGARASVSVNVGCVRMTERHLRDDPPTPPQVAGAEADVRQALATARAAAPVDDAATAIFVAGTATTVAAIALELPSYDPDRIHGARLTAAQVDDVARRVIAMPRAARAALPVMHPGRVDVIGGGALVLRELVAGLGLGGIVVSEHDILDGIAISIA